jgi:ribosome-associated translation inhibitor RaiA
MNVSMTYKAVEFREPVEAVIGPHIKKLEKLLKSYSPDLVQLHCVVARFGKKDECNVTLNLTLPTGTLHCVGTGLPARASVNEAFHEIETQIKKHKAHLRHDYEWKRKRPRNAVLA